MTKPSLKQMIGKKLTEYAVNDHEKAKKEKTETISTDVLPLNILLSGRVDGGIAVGEITMFAAQSMSGKSFLAMGIIRNAMLQGKKVVVIDSENAFDYNLAEALGIDYNSDNFMLFSTLDVTEVIHIIANINDNTPVDQKRDILYVLDSLGTLSAPTQIAKYLKGDEKDDMKLKQLKPALANLFAYTKSTVFCVNHITKNIGGIGEAIQIPGGERWRFNSKSIMLGAGRSKDTNSADEITGHIIKVRAVKARGCVEDSSLEFRIKAEGGLDVYYGLLPIALDAGVVIIPSQGYYSRPVVEGDKKWRESQIYNSEFWAPIFRSTHFKQYIEDTYRHKGKVLDIAGVSIGDITFSDE